MTNSVHESGAQAESVIGQATHTPGPWRVVYSERNGAALRIDSSEGWDVPGAVGSVVRQNGIGMPACGVGHANARLIAAAPDMLVALKACLARLTDHVGEWEIPLECEQMARAAIAKAEGRT